MIRPVSEEQYVQYVRVVLTNTFLKSTKERFRKGMALGSDSVENSTKELS
jgi:hypothetical protein